MADPALCLFLNNYIIEYFRLASVNGPMGAQGGNVSKILILGAGFGGITTALRLRGALDSSHEITLVDRRDKFYMGLTKPWALTGMRPLSEGMRSLDTLAKKGVRIVQADVRKIDPASKSVETSAGAFSWDHLVLAMGAETAPEAVEGLPASSNFYDGANIPALHESLKAFTKGKLALLICSSPYKCPPAPYETAMLLESWFTERGDRKSVEIAVYVPDPAPLMVAGPPAGQKALEICAQKNIRVPVQHKIKRVDAAGKRLFFENGAEEGYDFLLAIPPHRVPAVVKEAGLTDASSWVPVDTKTLATPWPGIHACGDLTGLKLPEGGMLPKAGLFAELEGEIVADRILAALGKGQAREFDGKGYCYFEAGGGEAMKVEGEFFRAPMDRVRMAPPSAQAFKDKQAFETDRLKKWFS